MGRALYLAAAALVLPLALLLFAQWPLREWLQIGSREANDLAQILFALYVAVAVSAATRDGSHLGTAQRRAPGRWRAWALLGCVAPWALFTLWSSAPQLLASLRLLERFPETMNPGYFLIKLSMALMLLLALGDALRALLRRPDAAPLSDHGA